MKTEDETRYQRIAREQAERQAARAKRREQECKAQRKASRWARQRTADKIDGYDRDDLGLSPDY